jgi:hypothetical protein
MAVNGDFLPDPADRAPRCLGSAAAAGSFASLRHLEMLQGFTPTTRHAAAKFLASPFSTSCSTACTLANCVYAHPGRKRTLARVHTRRTAWAGAYLEPRRHTITARLPFALVHRHRSAHPLRHVLGRPGLEELPVPGPVSGPEVRHGGRIAFVADLVQRGHVDGRLGGVRATGHLRIMLHRMRMLRGPVLHKRADVVEWAVAVVALHAGRWRRLICRVDSPRSVDAVGTASCQAGGRERAPGGSAGSPAASTGGGSSAG